VAQVTSYRAQGSRRPNWGLRALRGPPAGPADIVEAETAPHVRLAPAQALGPQRESAPCRQQRCCTDRLSSWDLYKWPIIGNRRDRAGGAFLIGALLIQRAQRRSGGVGAGPSACVRDASGRPVGHPEPSPRGRSGAADRPATPAPRRGARGRPGQPGRGDLRTRAWRGSRIHGALDGVRARPAAVERGGFPGGQARAQGHIVFFARLDELPLEAETDRQSLSRLAGQSRWSRSP
jgi:hypothetical protein